LMLLRKLLPTLQSETYTHVKMQPNAPLHVCRSKTTTAIKVAASEAAAAAADQLHAQGKPKCAATKDEDAHAQGRHASSATNSAEAMTTASANAGQWKAPLMSVPAVMGKP